MNTVNTKQYDEISDDNISDDEFSGFANTTKFLLQQNSSYDEISHDELSGEKISASPSNVPVTRPTMVHNQRCFYNLCHYHVALKSQV